MVTDNAARYGKKKIHRTEGMKVGRKRRRRGGGGEGGEEEEKNEESQLVCIPVFVPRWIRLRVYLPEEKTSPTLPRKHVRGIWVDGGTKTISNIWGKNDKISHILRPADAEEVEKWDVDNTNRGLNVSLTGWWRGTMAACGPLPYVCKMGMAANYRANAREESLFSPSDTSFAYKKRQFPITLCTPAGGAACVPWLPPTASRRPPRLPASHGKVRRSGRGEGRPELLRDRSTRRPRV